MKKLLVGIFAMAGIWLFVGSAISATYYVSPSGSDSNAGSLAAPFKTLAKAARLVSPGDTVIAAPGIYYENDHGKGQVGLYVRRGGNSAGPVVFQSSSPGEAIIDGNNTVQIGVYVSAPYVQFQGFRVRNFTFQGIDVYGNNATIQGNIVNGNGAGTTVQTAYGHDGIYTDRSVTNCMISGNIIYANGRLSLAKTAPGGNQDHGIYLGNANSTVQNNFISGNQAWGIHITGSVPLGSTLVQGNTIVDNGQSGIIMWQAGAKGCVIQNNTLKGNAAYGLDFLNDGMGHIVRGNLFIQNVSGGINPAMAAHYMGSNNLFAP